jgi:hypothetical protein
LGAKFSSLVWSSQPAIKIPYMIGLLPESGRHSGIIDGFSYHNGACPASRPSRLADRSLDHHRVRTDDDLASTAAANDPYKNCGEHCDPGYFTVSPVSAVRGLQLRDRASGRWLYVEDFATSGVRTWGWMLPGAQGPSSSRLTPSAGRASYLRGRVLGGVHRRSHHRPPPPCLQRREASAVPRWHSRT